jgi:nucleoside-diphosphate-sugar epimerase
MKIFVTGASGFVGSAVVSELISAGHQVIGLARSEESAKIVRDLGAEVLSGDLEDLDILKQGALEADGVIHTAFIHDYSQYLKAAEVDKNTINAIGETLIGTQKPFVVTTGMLGLPAIDGFVTEESSAENSPRGSELTTLALAEKGVNASVVRLARSVHDKGDKGFVSFVVAQARKNGVSAYPNSGDNQWCAVHRTDAAKAYRLAIEKSTKGAVYNIVGENGIKIKEIAELIGKELNLPVQSVSGDDIVNHFEWLSPFIASDGAATSLKTQEQLGWKPTQIGLLQDIQENYLK